MGWKFSNLTTLYHNKMLRVFLLSALLALSSGTVHKPRTVGKFYFRKIDLTVISVFLFCQSSLFLSYISSSFPGVSIQRGDGTVCKLCVDTMSAVKAATTADEVEVIVWDVLNWTCFNLNILMWFLFNKMLPLIYQTLAVRTLWNKMRRELHNISQWYNSGVRLL